MIVGFQNRELKMTFLTVSAHLLTDEFVDQIQKEYQVTIKDRTDEPWTVVFEGERDDLINMFSDHWTNGDEDEQLSPSSPWLSDVFVARKKQNIETNATSPVAEIEIAGTLLDPEELSTDQSYGEAEEVAASKLSWALVDGQEAKKYEGKIMGATDHHAIQSLGKTAVIHHKHNLERVPEKDEILSISYDGVGKAQVSAKTQDKGVGR